MEEEEEPMNLPNDIRLKIEKSPDKEDIFAVVGSSRERWRGDNE
jgi:hypothetical protein